MRNPHWIGVACIAVAAAVAQASSLVPITQADKKIEQLKETDTFTADSPKDKVKTDCPGKRYELNCVAGRTYTIELRSEDFDAYLRLEDASGKTIEENDDGGGGPKGTDAKIVFKAKTTATFTIAATSFNAAAKGKYTLTVLHDGAGSENEVKYLLDVTAKLTKDDRKDKDRGGKSYFKSYKIEMKEKTTYIIQLDSKDFDAFLRLLNAFGTEVAHDDDGAKDGLNAKIVYPCDQTGIYTVIATASANPDTGEFRLRIHAKK
jgi:hypothetical protein